MGFKVVKQPAASKKVVKAAIDAAVKNTAFAVAKLVTERIQWNVRNEVLHLEPKKRANGDPRPLINTGAYIDGLRPVHVGKRSAAIRGDVTLMKRLELGTRTMPARPHIRPTLRQLRKEIGAEISTGIVTNLLGDKK